MAPIIRAGHNLWVLTALTIFLTVVGLLLITLFPWSGAACCAGAYWLSKRTLDEESFVTALVLLASLGVLAEVVQFVIEH